MSGQHGQRRSGQHVCPWWFGYTFDNPLRRLFHDPAALLGGLVAPGDTVADIGCGLGHFTLGLARLVGPQGRVVAVDLQPEMTGRARRRAERRGLADRIEFRVCSPDRLGLDRRLDFALAFWMVHETPDPAALLAELKSALEPKGSLLIAEPRGHVSEADFADTLALAAAAGFRISAGPRVRLSRSALCTAGP